MRVLWEEQPPRTLAREWRMWEFPGGKCISYNVLDDCFWILAGLVDHGRSHFFLELFEKREDA